MNRKNVACFFFVFSFFFVELLRSLVMSIRGRVTHGDHSERSDILCKNKKKMRSAKLGGKSWGEKRPE
jgi:hypothetical protein